MTLLSRSRFLAGVASAILLTTSAGCSINKMVADTTAGLINEGSPALEAMSDYDLAGYGIPGAIVQLELFFHISPKNPNLGVNLAKAYIGYGQGWVEHQYEVADDSGRLEEADALRARARNLYLRGRDIAVSMLRARKKGIDEAFRAGEVETEKFLKKNYKKKSDAAALFWAGAGWGAAIDMSRDQPDLIVDLPIAEALVARAKELDETYYTYGPGMFLGAAEAALPEAMGGNPVAGKALFDEALDKSGRKNLMIQFQMARTLAVNTQNKEMFLKLLNEIVEAPDLGPETRLPNAIARHRAAFYLKRVDTLF